MGNGEKGKRKEDDFLFKPHSTVASLFVFSFFPLSLFPCLTLPFFPLYSGALNFVPMGCRAIRGPRLRAVWSIDRSLAVRSNLGYRVCAILATPAAAGDIATRHAHGRDGNRDEQPTIDAREARRTGYSGLRVLAGGPGPRRRRLRPAAWRLALHHEPPQSSRGGRGRFDRPQPGGMAGRRRDHRGARRRRDPRCPAIGRTGRLHWESAPRLRAAVGHGRSLRGRPPGGRAPVGARAAASGVPRIPRALVLGGDASAVLWTASGRRAKPARSSTCRRTPIRPPNGRRGEGP